MDVAIGSSKTRQNAMTESLEFVTSIRKDAGIVTGFPSQLWQEWQFRPSIRLYAE